VSFRDCWDVLCRPFHSSRSALKCPEAPRDGFRLPSRARLYRWNDLRTLSAFDEVPVGVLAAWLEGWIWTVWADAAEP
jgi:hypothetical protein